MTTLMGIAFVIFCAAISVMWPGAGGFGFFNVPSAICVFGGVIGAAVASYPPAKLKRLIKAVGTAFYSKDIDFIAEVDKMVDIANIARREGLVGLDALAGSVGNPFLRKGILLICECSNAETVQNIMETDMTVTRERHGANQAMLLQMAVFAPAFGLLGTLAGIIKLLGAMESAAAFGYGVSFTSGVAFALIAALYGLLPAYAVFTPLAKKLKSHSDDEYLQKEIQLEGLLSVMNGVHPLIIRESLGSFLSRRLFIKTDRRGE